MENQAADQASFLCPITGKIMLDPYTDIDGNSYDGPTILEWIDRYGISPITGQKISKFQVQPNPHMKALISKIADVNQKKIYSSDDSPRKKLIKLMKYSVKMVKSKRPTAPAPDYDAILRFRKLHPPASYHMHESDEQKDESLPELGLSENRLGKKADDLKSIEGITHLDRARSGSFTLKRDSLSDAYTEIPLESSESVLNEFDDDQSIKSAKRKPKGKRKKKTLSTDELENHLLTSEEQQSVRQSVMNHVVESKRLGKVRILSGSDDDDEDYDDGEFQFDGKEINQFDSPWYSDWNPVKNTIDIWLSDDIELSGDDVRALGGVQALCFFWLLTASMQTVLSLFVSGFSVWLDGDGSFVKMLATSQYSSAYSAAFVVLGYMVPRTFLGTVINSGKTSWFQVPTFRHCIGFLLSGIMRVGPPLYVTIAVALLFGKFSGKASILANLYTTCSANWMTNLGLVTNFSIFWLGKVAVYGTLGITDDSLDNAGDNSLGNSLEEYGDFNTCFPSLWAVSCAAQMVLISVPIMYTFAIHAYKGIALSVIWIIVAVTARTLIAMEVRSPFLFAQVVYYNPLTRGDAFALGMLVYMARQAAFMPPPPREKNGKSSPSGSRGRPRGPSGLGPPSNRRHSRVRYNSKKGCCNTACLASCLATCLEPLYNQVALSAAARSDKYWSSGIQLRDEETQGLLEETKRKKKKRRKKGSSVKFAGENDSEFLEAMENGLASSDRVNEFWGRTGLDGRDADSLIARGNQNGDMEDESLPRSRRRQVTFMLDEIDDSSSDRTGSSSSTDDMHEEQQMSMLNIALAVFALIVLGGGICWLSYGNPEWVLPLSNRQFQNLTMLVAAVSTASLVFLAVEGTLWQLQMLLSAPCWYPVASLCYTGYLLQMLTVFVFASRLPGPDAGWYGSWWDYSEIYGQLLAANLAVAFILSVLVERPFMSLSTRLLSASRSEEM